MKLTKRLLAAAAAVVLSVSAASCGDGDSSAERADSRKADSAADSSSAPDDSSETSENDPSSEAGDSSSETKDEKQEVLDKLGKRDIKVNTVRILATQKADLTDRMSRRKLPNSLRKSTVQRLSMSLCRGMSVMRSCQR